MKRFNLEEILHTWRFRYKQYLEHSLFSFSRWCAWAEVVPIESIPTSISDTSDESDELSKADHIIRETLLATFRRLTPVKSDEYYDMALADVFSYGGVTHDGKLIGYDFCLGSLDLPPLISKEGDFYGRYAHVLPALVLNRFIKEKEVSFPHIQTSVICHGFDYIGEDAWWNSDKTPNYKDCADKMVENLIKSEAFREVLKKWYKVEMLDANGQCGPGATFELSWNEAVKVRRLCIWLTTTIHVFVVVWEKHDDLDFIYTMDNDEDNPTYREYFIKSFGKALKSIGNGKLSLRKQRDDDDFVSLKLPESLVSVYAVPVEGPLACVSFMARCTALLCTFDDYKKLYDILNIESLASIEELATVYRCFEDSLFDLFEREKRKNRCLWLPIDLNCKFLNIEKVHLMSVDYNKKGLEIVSDAQRMCYNGVKHIPMEDPPGKSGPWVPLDPETPGGCACSSRYRPPLVPNYHLRIAGILLAECESLLSGLRLNARF